MFNYTSFNCYKVNAIAPSQREERRSRLIAMGSIFLQNEPNSEVRGKTMLSNGHRFRPIG
jgi:hypothetical protein